MDLSPYRLAGQDGCLATTRLSVGGMTLQDRGEYDRKHRIVVPKGFSEDAAASMMIGSEECSPSSGLLEAFRVHAPYAETE